MSKTSQAKNTLYLQGMADGRAGRPFRYVKIRKRDYTLVVPHNVYYRSQYALGYRLGKAQTQPTWLGYFHNNKRLKQIIIFLGGVMGCLLFSTLIQGL